MSAGNIFQVISLELSTGIPMLYIFKEGNFIRRGSPAGPSEAGVYAYTRVCNFSLLFCSSYHHGITQTLPCVFKCCSCYGFGAKEI